MKVKKKKNETWTGGKSRKHLTVDWNPNTWIIKLFESGLDAKQNIILH